MPRWTTESRARQAERIRTWKPWKASTGPVSMDGKAASAANRADHFRRLDEELRRARQELRQVQARITRLMCSRKRSIAEWAALADDLDGA